MYYNNTVLNTIHTGSVCIVVKGRKDQEEIVRESRAAFRTEPLQSVYWGRGTEGIVKKRKKESEMVCHVGNSKENKSNDQRHRTCRGQMEN